LDLARRISKKVIVSVKNHGTESARAAIIGGPFLRILQRAAALKEEDSGQIKEKGHRTSNK